MVILVKPQFELGRARIGKGGLVAGDPEDAARAAAAWVDAQPGWRGLGWTESPIAGGDGNREFLLAAVRRA